MYNNLNSPVRLNLKKAIELQPEHPASYQFMATLKKAQGLKKVSIVSPHGKLVRSYAAPGQRVFWDGRDNKGRRVLPGIYIIQIQGAKESIHRAFLLNKL